LCRYEDRQVVAEDEQVLIACDQVRAAVDREREEIVVVRVARADWRWACRILGDASVVANPVDEGVGFVRRRRRQPA
jgi:hypothetical protein